MHTKSSYIISLLVLAGVLQAVSVPDTEGGRKEELGAPLEFGLTEQANKRQKSASSAGDGKQQALGTQSAPASSLPTDNSQSKPSTVLPSVTIVEDKRARLSNDKKVEQLMSLLLAELPTLDIASLSGASGAADNSGLPETLPARQGLKGRGGHHQLVYIDNSAYRNEKYTPCFFNAITCFPWIRTRHARSPA